MNFKLNFKFKMCASVVNVWLLVLHSAFSFFLFLHRIGIFSIFKTGDVNKIDFKDISFFNALLVYEFLKYQTPHYSTFLTINESNFWEAERRYVSKAKSCLFQQQTEPFHNFTKKKKKNYKIRNRL